MLLHDDDDDDDDEEEEEEEDDHGIKNTLTEYPWFGVLHSCVRPTVACVGQLLRSKMLHCANRKTEWKLQSQASHSPHLSQVPPLVLPLRLLPLLRHN